jgi:hypothetical protein
MSTVKLRNIIAATIVGGSAFFLSENVWTTASPTSLVTQAEARIGRPWTPLSVAGVARRHYRRAVVASAITGGALAAGYGYGYGYGYPFSSYATGYSNFSYGYGYPNYETPNYGYGYSYPNYGYGYGYRSYGYPYRYASLGWRRWW